MSFRPAVSDTHKTNTLCEVLHIGHAFKKQISTGVCPRIEHECSICFGPMVVYDDDPAIVNADDSTFDKYCHLQVEILTCGHAFHRSCMVMTISSQNTRNICPICNEVLSSTDVERLRGELDFTFENSRKVDFRRIRNEENAAIVTHVHALEYELKISKQNNVDSQRLSEEVLNDVVLELAELRTYKKIYMAEREEAERISRAEREEADRISMDEREEADRVSRAEREEADQALRAEREEADQALRALARKTLNLKKRANKKRSGASVETKTSCIDIRVNFYELLRGEKRSLAHINPM
jgi:hypothetical protein